MANSFTAKANCSRGVYALGAWSPSCSEGRLFSPEGSASLEVLFPMRIFFVPSRIRSSSSDCTGGQATRSPTADRSELQRLATSFSDDEEVL